jgi:acyl carrier protein
MLDQVRAVLIETLQLGDRANQWRADTELLGQVPELDSLAVMSVITALETRFGFHIADDEISADDFTTLGALVAFVDGKLRTQTRESAR